MNDNHLLRLIVQELRTANQLLAAIKANLEGMNQPDG